MNSPDMPQEPLNNVELESAIFGLRMALTPDEEVEARQKFLATLAGSTLAVPTVEPAPTGPDGQILPNAQITFVVATSAEGVTGVPGFTTLGGLRATLPQVENGMFLTGAQLAGMLAQSEHRLFVDGPDLHAEIVTEELAGLAQAAQQMAQAQQEAVQHNRRLEETLGAMRQGDTPEAREAIVAAFLEGFCRLPIAGEQDGDAECVVLNLGDPNAGQPVQEIELLTVEGGLPCFAGEDALRAWDESGARNAIAFPGLAIAQLAAQAGVTALLINPGSESSQTLRIEQDRLFVA